MILYRVQTVPGREGPLARLSTSLPAAREAILDPDAGDPNPWRGYRRCLENLGDASHVVVLQDDTIVCRGFAETIEKVASARPSTLTSLFVGGLHNRNTRDFYRALAANRRWSRLISLNRAAVIHVVALMWPAQLAREFLAWADENQARLPGHRNVPKSDDAIVTYWTRKTKQEVWATVPCLVQHPDDVPSVAGHNRAANGRDKGRTAASWVGLDVDPSTLDWSLT